MRGGCLKNVLASVGCLTVLVLVGFVAWEYRGQVARAYRSVVAGDDSNAEASRPAVGVRLTADEMASLIEDRLDPVARRALDSLRVTLDHERFTLEGQILLDVFSRDLLGPIAQILDTRQPLRVGGPVALREPGVVAWACDEFVIASFPFPQSAIPRLIDQLTGGDDGAFLIPIPDTVGEVHVGTDGVTFYRRGE
jgi:hypothetical protein